MSSFDGFLSFPNADTFVISLVGSVSGLKPANMHRYMGPHEHAVELFFSSSTAV